MQIIPALDIRDGSAVRLRQGNYEDEIRYSIPPEVVIEEYVQHQVPLIHVVDLDSARDGRRRHAEVLRSLCDIPGANIELGGGIRSREDVLAALDLGVTRVVMGTAAVETPDAVAAICQEFPGSIAIGIDIRDGWVATRGWTEASQTTLSSVVRHYSEVPVAAYIITEISRDGMLNGPDPEHALAALDLTDAEIIVSGGVGTVEHLVELTTLRSAAHRPIDGVILGRALYENRLTLADALAATAPSHLRDQ